MVPGFGRWHPVPPFEDTFSSEGESMSRRQGGGAEWLLTKITHFRLWR